ncbi:hypothetical protein [Nocardia sp. NPDC051981]|uniref:hypothetical protein n=1 Tax=Nocardia sp. NPDC051981 TaxID=3155417 RepID=UPI003443E0FB
MLRWRDFLDRFRPAGAPGAAGPHGVPADRAAEAAAELTPLLRRLDTVQDAADRLRAEAQHQAERIRADGLAEARSIVETASTATESVSDATMAAALARTAADSPDDATVAIAALRARADERLPGYVQRVVARARADLDVLSASDPTAAS